MLWVKMYTCLKTIVGRNVRIFGEVKLDETKKYVDNGETIKNKKKEYGFENSIFSSGSCSIFQNRGEAKQM